MNSFSVDRFLAYISSAIIFTSLAYAASTRIALAQTPSPEETRGNGATELEINGQSPSISAPSTSPTPPKDSGVDMNETAPSWKVQEEELQREQEDSPPDSPPPGSVTPDQDSPDQIKVPL
jgi:hypothetical protein